MECVKNVERLVSRCEDILGKKIKIRGQDWRIVKVIVWSPSIFDVYYYIADSMYNH